MNDKVFDAYSRYYDLLYSDKDYKSDVLYIKQLLTEHGIVGGDLLEFGSGTGAHGNLLADFGYRVHGVELSAEMVKLAKVSERFTCKQGDICSVEMGRTYDAVLSLFHVLSYLTSNKSIKDVFDRARAHLELGGLFVFDIWYSPAVISQRPSVRVKRISDSYTSILRIAEPVDFPNQNRIDVNYTIYAQDLVTGVQRELKETHSMRHFSIPELDIYAEISGFERIRAEEFITGRELGIDTWGACLIYRLVKKL